MICLRCDKEIPEDFEMQDICAECWEEIEEIQNDHE